MAHNQRRGFDWRRALPRGYRLSLLGAGIFAVGGGLDLVWHELFGVEVDLEPLLRPTHLVLALGGVLMASGPLRAAWARRGARGWLALGPALIAAALFLSVLTFFTAYAHPLQNGFAGGQAGQREPRDELYLMNADGDSQTRLAGEPAAPQRVWRVLARRPADRVCRRRWAGRMAPVCDECRWQRPSCAHGGRRVGLVAGLVAGRGADRVHQRPGRRLTANSIRPASRRR